MTPGKLTEKLKAIGFKFTQGEFCTKDLFFACLDCYPYLADSGRNKSIWFKTWGKFLKFYNENKQNEL